MPHPLSDDQPLNGMRPIFSDVLDLVRRAWSRLSFNHCLRGNPVGSTPLLDFRQVASVLTDVPAMRDQLIGKLLFDMSRERQAPAPARSCGSDPGR
jgi:hypothetical protein